MYPLFPGGGGGVWGEHSLAGEGAGGGANCDISMQFYAAKNIHTIVPTL